MSLLSKILAILNLLGILAVAYLAIMVYNKRQAWEYSAMRHELMIEGLPLDELETDKRGDVSVDNLSEVTLKELFPSNPVSTQTAEVKRVLQLLEGNINAAQGTAEKISLYATYLTPFAERYSERADLISLRLDLKDQQSSDLLKQDLKQLSEQARPSLQLQGPVGTSLLAVFAENAALPFDQAYDQALVKLQASLKSEFDGHFQRVLSAQTLGQTFRREAISKLLLATLEFTQPEPAGQAGQPGNPDAPAQEPYQTQEFQRYFRVVGIKAAIPALNERASQLGEFVTTTYVNADREFTLSSELSQKLNRDRNRFASTHQKLIDYLETRAYQLKTQSDELLRVTTLAKDQEALVEERKKDIVIFDDRLKALQTQTNDLLVELRTMSDALFDITIQTRDARRLNQQYAQEIEQMEQNLKRKENR